MEKLWTTADVARYLGINEEGVERLVREGKLTGQKLGGRFLRFQPDQVKTLAPVAAPAPQAVAAAAADRVLWHERLRDLVAFYDLYLLAGMCIVGLLVYLVSSG